MKDKLLFLFDFNNFLVHFLRIKADIRISIKNNKTGECYKIELIRQPFGISRYWIRFNGRQSNKLPEATLTDITVRIRKWLKKM